MDESIITFRDRLNNFINQYYLNRFVRGIIFFVLGLLFIILTGSFIEYLAWSSSNFRLFLLLSSILGIIFIFYYFLLIPILRYFNILPKLTHKHAIKILSFYFPESKDLLINILELVSLHSNDAHNELILASIDQKIKISKKFNFNDAVNKKNYTPLYKYLGGLCLLYFSILIFKPEILIDSSSRIIHFNQSFENSNEFSIFIDSADLVVEKGQNKKISIKVIGNNLPEDLNIKINNHEFLLNKESKDLYSYDFKNVVNAFTFKIVNSYFTSREYNLKILYPPTVLNYQIRVNCPKYLDIEDIIVNDKLSVKVPFGSDIFWSFITTNVDSLLVLIDSNLIVCENKNNIFSFKLRAEKDFKYSILGKNKELKKQIYSENHISIIPDFYPTIFIEERSDSINFNLVYFKGIIDDDYGFSKLTFNINNGKSDTIINIPFFKNTNNQEFYFVCDYTMFSGDFFKSFFEVFDNDEFSGFKSSKSRENTFKKHDITELKKESETKQINMEKNIEYSSYLTHELIHETEEIKKKVLNENLTNFEKGQLIGDLVDKHKQLNELINQVSKENLKKANIDNQVSKQEKEILEKTNKIQELLDSLMTDELKELFKELEKLKNEFNQDKFNELAKDLERNMNELSKQLDKNLELLRRLDVEKQVKDIINNLSELSKNQELLSEQILKNKSFDSINSLNIQDQKIAEQTKELYKDVLEKNEKLEKPYNVGSFNMEFEILKEQIKNGVSLENKREINSKNVIDNAQKAKELANNLESLVNESQNNENGEDALKLRQILENLLYFSFKQEDIEEKILSLSKTNPNYNEFLASQYNLINVFEIVKDSLFELSKRTPNLGNHISKKTFSIESKLLEIRDYDSEDALSKINLNQRYIIEYSNDLILLLAESLKNIENQPNSGGGSSNQKNKHKPAKPSLSEMRKSQEGLKEQLEEMINQLKKDGSKSGSSKTESYAKMLAQQEIFQQMINQINGNNGIGKDVAKELNEINKLIEENKRDIANLKVSQQTINRQQQIITRLLEAEKAEQERELENKRESQEAVNYEKSNIKLKFEENFQITNFEELFSKSSIQLQYFYKNKYQDYINRLNQKPDEERNKNSVEN